MNESDGGGAARSGTPRFLERGLPPEPGSVPTARRFVLSSGWARDDDTYHRLGTLVSELVTNAVLHARTPFLVKVTVAPDLIRVSVTDGDRTQPLMKQHGLSDPTGRGLRIVDAMADRWGVDPDVDGKTVWFELERLDQTA